VEELARDLGASYGDTPLREAMTALAVEGLLVGPVSGTVRVELEDGSGERRTMPLARSVPSGRPASIGHLPVMYVELESRTLAGGVGYVRFDAFLDPAWLMPAFGEAVSEFMDAPGIVLDLRGNPGGIGAMAMGIGGWFVDRSNLELGTMRTRDTELRFVLNPRPRAYGGRLAVLVDACSMSTSEILAGGLQDLGRARVFGTPTAGAALPSIIERLPSGDGFQYAFAHYTSVGGRVLEGNGVVPDVVVEPEREALLAGHDPALDAAVAWIRDGRRAQAQPGLFE
jgi:carboxyl-terminal processing protease